MKCTVTCTLQYEADGPKHAAFLLASTLATRFTSIDRIVVKGFVEACYEIDVEAGKADVTRVCPECSSLMTYSKPREIIHERRT